MANKRNALIVANNLYSADSGLEKLVAPPQDAEALASVLRNPQIGGFEVQTLINETSQAAMEAIESLFEEGSREDLLLLYFSGHGIKDENGLLYFAVANTRLNRLRSTAIKANLVNEMMLHSRSRQQVLMLDCCYSGAFARGMQAKADKRIHTQEYFSGRGLAILTASDSIQYAFEGDKVIGANSLSVFTGKLIQGLEMGEADLDRDGLVHFDELYEYIRSAVANDARTQSPMKWELGVNGKILIAYNPKPIANNQIPEASVPAKQPFGLGVLIGERYLVQKYLSRTGISELFLVHDQELERDGTFNIIHKSLLEDQGLTKHFEEEGRVLAQLKHPNIVQVYDRGKFNGLPYTVTQYLSGGSLADKMKKGRLLANEIKSLLLPLLDAMSFIHQKGIVHNNIQPSSIQFDDNDTPYLTGFSISKIDINSTNSNEDPLSGIMIGTPNYGSPEHARGDKIDFRSDLYALGVVLYEMLAGHVPFESDDTLSVLYRTINETPPPIAGISPALQDVLNSVLAKNPEDRYQSAQDLKEALAKYL